MEWGGEEREGRDRGDREGTKRGDGNERET